MTRTSRGAAWRVVALVAAVLVSTAQIGRRGGRGNRADPATPCAGEPIQQVNYDGRFTFLRLRFEPSSDAGGWGDLKWNHDCYRGERHFAKILKEITFIDPYTDASKIVSLDDPELFKYPIAYMCEPGFWTLTDREAANFRAYLLKGGFAIFDDFRDWDWQNFDAQIHRVLPGAQLVELDEHQAVFDSFFRLKTIHFQQMYDRSPSHYYGIYEDNDPGKRLMVIVNYNNDISEYWEWSDDGYVPIELSNEAYKLGVNYVMYGMTH